LKTSFLLLFKKSCLIVSGFAIAAAGLVIMLKSQLGMGPWGALEVGLSKLTGLTVGQCTQIVSLVLILLSWALGVKPSIVTFANMFFIGFFMDLFSGVIPLMSPLLCQLFFNVVGLIVYAFGISFYLVAARGNSGPRESMMLGIFRLFKISIGASKIIVDLGALIIAFIIKGPIGIGTFLFALAAGPCIQFFLRLRGYRTVQGKLAFDRADRKSS
jgi:uncharacterized membrane protein YczE